MTQHLGRKHLREKLTYLHVAYQKGFNTCKHDFTYGTKQRGWKPS